MVIKAYAKLNLSLDICGKREDGYHLIDSVMLSVDPFDIINIEKSENIEILCSDRTLGGKENIAYKAAEFFFEFTGIKGGVKVNIEKHIPEAAGLGGGSSDAAAVIRGLDRLYESHLSYNDLCRIALNIGADVPFCINGGAARAEGIGEICTPLKLPESLIFVLAKNGNKKSTKEMYSILDNSEEIKIKTTEKLIRAIEGNNYSETVRNISNAFICAAGLYGIDEILKETDYSALSLSGSGPTVFGVYSNIAKAQKAFGKLQALNIKSFIARPQSKGIVFE